MEVQKSLPSFNMSSIEILSEDPEVQSLKGYIHAANHFERKNLSLRHLQILMAVEMLVVVMKERGYPRAKEIATQIGMKIPDFESALNELVEHRYLHETIPKYGDLSNTTYKVGTMGGALMKRMLRR